MSITDTDTDTETTELPDIIEGTESVEIGYSAVAIGYSALHMSYSELDMTGGYNCTSIGCNCTDNPCTCKRNDHILSRLTNQQRDCLYKPIIGEMKFNRDSGKFFHWDGNKWIEL